eukprot:195653_1
MSVLSHQIYRDVKICSSAIVCTFHFLLFIVVARRLYKETIPIKQMAPLMLAYILDVICVHIINIIGGIYNNYNLTDAVYITIALSYAVTLTFMFVISYIFFVGQLYYTFKNTEYQISHKIIYSHFILITFITILSILTMIGYIGLLNFQLTTSRLLTSFLILVYVIGIFHLIYLINHKLFILCVKQSCTMNEQNNFTINQPQFNLLQNIARLSVSCGCILCSLIIIAFTAALAGILKHNVVIQIIFWCVFMICIMFISTCFCLTLAINKTVYYYFCGVCDRKCISICSNIAKHSVLKRKANIENADI